MVVRNCAGGVVFQGDSVFLLKNDKAEWVLPKGVIRGRAKPQEVALGRVESEAGVQAKILSDVGQTSYEFYSTTRRTPVRNLITWYLMEAENASFRVAYEQGFTDGGFFLIQEALEMITYTQDRSLVSVAYEKYKEWKAPV